MIFTTFGTHLTAQHKGKMMDYHNEGIEHGDQIETVEQNLQIGPKVAKEQHKHRTDHLDERAPAIECGSMDYPHIVRIIGEGIDCSDKKIYHKAHEIPMIVLANATAREEAVMIALQYAHPTHFAVPRSGRC